MRPWLLILGALGAVVAVVAIGISVAGDESSQQPVTQDPQAVAAGSELYTANCAACHGPDLLGTSTGPPFLNVIYAPNHHADEAFQRAVATGVTPHHWNFGTMAPIGGLSPDDIALIVGFVRSEQEAAGIFRDPSHP